MTPQSLAWVKRDSIKGEEYKRNQFRGEMRHSTLAILILNGLKGIQVGGVWAGDTKLMSHVFTEGDGDRRKI